MGDVQGRDGVDRLRSALWQADASERLQAALTAGTRPDDRFIDVLVERCEVEPDFYVRDMLTWALTRHDRAYTVAALLAQLESDIGQARSQALHTLSKIADPDTWSAVTPALLRDSDPEVARAAWRTAAGLVPVGGEEQLASQLASQFGRGDRDTQRSLSRAFATIGPNAKPVVELAVASGDDTISTHALATLTIMDAPEEPFDAAVEEAKRVVALRAAPRRD